MKKALFASLVLALVQIDQLVLDTWE